MLHACVQRFDVTGNLENFCKILETKQALTMIKPNSSHPIAALLLVITNFLLQSTSDTAPHRTELNLAIVQDQRPDRPCGVH